MSLRKMFGLLVAAALLLPLIAACTPTAAPTVAPTEPPVDVPTQEATEAPTSEPAPVSAFEGIDPSGQTVVYWHQNTGSRAELMTSLVEDFNSTNEWGITVVEESQGGYNDLYTKIIAGIPAKQLPNMSVAYQNQAATYAVQGVLVELDPYVNDPVWGYTEEELADFFPIALAADYLPQFKGRYGWPPYKSMEVMYYNEDWLKELGFDGPPETWAEFEEMACKAVAQPFSKQTGEGPVLGYEYSVDASRFASFIFSRGGNVLNEDATSYVFNDAAGEEALTYLRGLVDKGCAAQTTEQYGDQTDFGAGRVLFTMSSISGLSYYGQAVSEGANFAWSVNPPPHTTAEPRLNIYGASQSIFAGTPEQQLASWVFLKWMSEPEQQAKWASSTGYYPTRASAAELMKEYMDENPTYAKAFQFLFYDSGVESPVAGYDECRAEISNMINAVLGGADAKPELDKAVEACNQYLEEAAP